MTYLALVVGLVIAVIAAVLRWALVPDPWDLLGLVVVGGALGYLVPALDGRLRARR